ncbi:hypothetical protein ABK040_015847 [Willaertia magna]
MQDIDIAVTPTIKTNNLDKSINSLSSPSFSNTRDNVGSNNIGFLQQVKIIFINYYLTFLLLSFIIIQFIIISNLMDKSQLDQYLTNNKNPTNINKLSINTETKTTLSDSGGSDATKPTSDGFLSRFTKKKRNDYERVFDDTTPIEDRVIRRKASGKKQIAILMPFIARQLPKIFFNWGRWGGTPKKLIPLRNKDSKHQQPLQPEEEEEIIDELGLHDNDIISHPCSQRLIEKEKNVEITYVMIFNQDLEDKIPPKNPAGRSANGGEDFALMSGFQVKQRVIDEWRKLNGRECFNGGLQLISSYTPHKHDQHPNGPCFMFFSAMDILEREGFDYYFQFEPDVIPIKSNWLDKILNESVHAPSDFWQKGSLSRCPDEYAELGRRQDFHMNGNALYKLGDPKFKDYIERVKTFYPAGNDDMSLPGCATGLVFERGYDHTMYRFRMHPKNWEYAKDIFHYFQYTDFFQNKCEEVYSTRKLWKESPNTYFVHSKAVFMSPEEKMFRVLFYNITKSIPPMDQPDIKLTLDKYSKGILVKDDIVKYICLRGEYINRVKKGDLSRTCLELCSDLTFLRKFEQLVPRGCSNYFEHLKWRDMYKDKMYLWTSDFHAAPIACNRDLLTQVGIVTHAEIDFGNCIFFEDTCKNRLKVLHHDNWRGFSLDPCPNNLRREFFEAYKNDAEMQRVDAVICSHPPANCELYLPFNKSLIVYATTRLEFGRNDRFIDWRKPYMTPANKHRWAQWIDNLIRIAKNPRNVIAANNLYDAHYIRYFTGLEVEYIPSWCGDLKVTWNPKKPEFLLGPYRDNLDYPRFSEIEAWKHPIMKGLLSALDRTKSKLKFLRMRQAYPHYKLEDLTIHPGIVLIPYQLSIMSFFEMYRMNIPLFVPSKSLMIKWQSKYNNQFERIYGDPERLVFTPKERYDPNSNDFDNLNYWLEFADYFVFPHLITFDSWEDLIDKIQNKVNLREVSEKMKQFNIMQKEQLKDTWARIKNKILHYSGGAGKSTLPETMEEGLAMYDLKPLGPDIIEHGVEKCKYQ